MCPPKAHLAVVAAVGALARPTAAGVDAAAHTLPAAARPAAVLPLDRCPAAAVRRAQRRGREAGEEGRTCCRREG